MPRFLARSRCAGWATLAAAGVPPGPHAGSGGVGDVTSSDDAASTSVSVTARGDTGGDCIVVMGSEGDGLRTNVLRECSGVISVPVSDDALVGGVDSLNVSVAAGILMASLCGVAPVAVGNPKLRVDTGLFQYYHSAT
jgi:hypothetical protein